jgi:hypothetical protein
MHDRMSTATATPAPSQPFGDLEKFVLGLLTDEPLHQQIIRPYESTNTESTPIPLHNQDSFQPKRRLISTTPANHRLESQSEFRPPSVHLLPILDGDPQEDVMAFLQLLRRSYPGEGDANAYYREQVVFHRDM